MGDKHGPPWVRVHLFCSAAYNTHHPKKCSTKDTWQDAWKRGVLAIPCMRKLLRWKEPFAENNLACCTHQLPPAVVKIRMRQQATTRPAAMKSIV